ncbi:outer membrane protein OmpA-like peptidoglycan-associated protein [Lutibacter sp. Hel_I_33_5]|uniref:OmpA family protein n=1 Tax=Lutibacter sp. Hel_I_33_5 TaxID=1566289 RepID=UPI00119F9880|nr:OmpA family protein [Lutibacter sp. Hel_I_33_5]TVZ55225.1 outer membrane protein OmpA-like peptidoglycan-associated protein [Lutibacter sp. Hel_I_33_5]
MKNIINNKIILIAFVMFLVVNIQAQEKDTKLINYKVHSVKGINDVGLDFSPVYYKDKLVFSSERADKKSFLDLYTIRIDNPKKGTSKIEKFSIEKLSKTYHISNIAFSKDYRTIYFTRNNYFKKRFKPYKKNVNRLKLYRAHRNIEDTEWESIKELPFNGDDFSTGHPSLSKDDKTLYFSSDRPGGYGKTDIYKVGINEDGSFGKIINLGKEVNSSEREMFPTTKENELYFSSDRNNGQGGLDIYKYNLNKKNEAINLGKTINSSVDDFGIVFNPENPNKGYFSSNRKGGLGSDDIYGFTEETTIIKPCEQIVYGVIKDKKLSTPIAFAKVIIQNAISKENIEELNADAKGNYSYTLPCSKNYIALASKEYYKEEQKPFSTSTKSGINNELNFNLELIDDLKYNNNNEAIININPIYFDTNKSTIRPDAAKELDYIVSVMNKYPEMKIKATSHTDSRGKDSYNEALSTRRAESTRSYITSQGISPSRITAIGYGESQPTNHCENGVKCSKEEHQLNRRTEFIIIRQKE